MSFQHTLTFSVFVSGVFKGTLLAPTEEDAVRQAKEKWSLPEHADVVVIQFD